MGSSLLQRKAHLSSPLMVCLYLFVCLGGDIAHNHDRWEVASHVRDVVDTRRRLGGLPGRGEERLGAKPVTLAPRQSRRDLHPGPGAGNTYRMSSRYIQFVF